MKKNDFLKNKHELTREETIKQVLEAVSFIHDNEGLNAKITANKLVEITGFSRSLFYKEHVLKVWNEKLFNNKYKKNTKNSFSKDSEDFLLLQEENHSLLSKLSLAEKRIAKLEEDLEKEKKRKEVYLIDLNEEKEKNTKLLGEVLNLQRKISSSGIRI